MHTSLKILFLAAIFLNGCKPQLKSKDFTEPGSFTQGIEGPAVDANGNIYAVNFKEEGTIGKVTPNGEGAIFVSLPDGSIGNGIRFGKNNTMFVADYTNHAILKIAMTSKDVSIFAKDSTANQPNDIAIAPNGIIYASDPNWNNNTGNLWKITEEKGFELVESAMGTTNGICVSPNGKKLYVNESIQRKVWVYDLLANGDITNKQEFFSFPDFGMDGMRCDAKGNVYITRYGKGTVVVLSPNGDVLNEIELIGKKPSNITFSNTYDICYITMADRGCIEIVYLE